MVGLKVRARGGGLMRIRRKLRTYSSHPEPRSGSDTSCYM